MTSWKKKVSIFFGSIGICQPIGFIDTLVDENSRVAQIENAAPLKPRGVNHNPGYWHPKNPSKSDGFSLMSPSLIVPGGCLPEVPGRSLPTGPHWAFPRAAATRAVDRYWSIARFYLGLALGGENSIESGSFLSHRGTPNSQTIHFYRPFPKQKNQPAIGMPFMETTDLAPPYGMPIVISNDIPFISHCPFYPIVFPHDCHYIPLPPAFY